MRLKEQLKGEVPDEHLSLLSNRFHVIGDVAIISLHPDLEEFKKDIARAIISRHRNIKTVLTKTSKLEGNERVATFELLCGIGTVTEHKEFGYIYRLDVSKVFFNSHLAYERNRIASKVLPEETVLVPFSGVGPFVVPMAAKGKFVVALESSADACRWLAENIRINGVEDKVAIIKADAFKAQKMLKIQFDRAVIPTPYGNDEALCSIGTLIRRGGSIHFYTFKKQEEIMGLIEAYKHMGYHTELFRKCGNVAPGVHRWAFDLKKR